MSIGRIGIIGAGAWGTALANAAALAGRDVLLWGRDADEIAAMQAARENRKPWKVSQPISCSARCCSTPASTASRPGCGNSPGPTTPRS